MILTNCVFITIALIALVFVANFVLDSLNAKNVKANSESVPSAFKDIIDDASYFKSVRYTLDKIRFGIIENAYTSCILILVFLFGIYSILFKWLTNLLGNSIWAGALTFCLILFILKLIYKHLGLINSCHVSHLKIRISYPVLEKIKYFLPQLSKQKEVIDE